MTKHTRPILALAASLTCACPSFTTETTHLQSLGEEDIGIWAFDATPAAQHRQKCGQS